MPQNQKIGAVSFLRASGGVSSMGRQNLLDSPFSPRKRRCFLAKISGL